MEPPAVQLTTPTEVVLALYDACNDADAALTGGDDRAALTAMRSIDDLVANDARFHLVDAEKVHPGPLANAHRALTKRGRPQRVVVHDDVVVALATENSEAGVCGVDVFRVEAGRVAEAWCLVLASVDHRPSG